MDRSFEWSKKSGVVLRMFHKFLTKQDKYFTINKRVTAEAVTFVKARQRQAFTEK